jgi:hypothetical protein
MYDNKSTSEQSR